MTQPAKPPSNPYLADVIRTALESTRSRPVAEAGEARIVVNGDRNLVAPGGVINVMRSDSSLRQDGV